MSKLCIPQRLLVLGIGIALCASLSAAPAARTGDDDLLAEMKKDSAQEEGVLLRVSHLSEVYRWPGVRKKEGEAGQWARADAAGHPGRIFSRPGADVTLRTLVDVPKAGDYRVWLAYQTASGESHPVTLGVEGKAAARHVFSGAPLPSPNWMYEKLYCRVGKISGTFSAA